MRIAVVGHVRHPIAEPFMGGMEAHSHRLCSALLSRGHKVTLFASGDSDPRFKINSILDEHYNRVFPWEHCHNDPALYEYLDQAFAKACPRIFSSDYDVVHNNSLHRFVLQYARATRIPTVTSLHVPPYPGIHSFVRQTISSTHVMTVTSAQQQSLWWPESAPRECRIVHNGIDLDTWYYSPRGEGHAIWCGRITPNKGPHFAIQAARRAHVPLRLFGHLEDTDYYNATIVPLLGDDAHYGGNLSTEALAIEMRAASAMLFTPCWDEPFGLVAAEAMACGVPVAAFDRGAAREVLGDTGIYASPGNVGSLADALRVALGSDRKAGHRRAEELFGVSAMCAKYELLYKQAISANKSGTARSD
jgi:glycosyltransferase involved in cell wall biosynthesis